MVRPKISPANTTPAKVELKRCLRIAYADDMPELRDVARLALNRDGHQVECFADGAHALARITADPGFDLVITDHHMPRMNGVELVTALRDIGFAGKIMVFSSELSDEIAQDYERLRVDRILYKPVFAVALQQALLEMFPPAAAKAD
jgi:two-component system, chemotaxis family, chemotaxis protein CheY